MDSRFKSQEPSLDPQRVNETAPNKPQFVSLPEVTQAHSASANAAVIQDWSPLHGVKASVQVCVGQAVVSVGELLSAKENQVLRLDRKIEQPVDLLIEGKTVARGQLVAVDGYFAVRITELPLALSLSSDT